MVSLPHRLTVEEERQVTQDMEMIVYRDVRPIVVGPPVATLRSVGLSVDDFNKLVTSATRNETLGQAHHRLYCRSLGLREHDTLPERIQDWYPVIEVDDPGLGVRPFFPMPTSDEEWERDFPARSAEAFHLLRLRPSRVGGLLDATQLAEVWSVIAQCWDADFVFFLNIVCATSVFGIEWFRLWVRLRAFRSVGVFVATAKALTSILKAADLPDEYLSFVECSGLTGFRLLPDPTFDIVAQTAASAQGLGDDHSTVDGLGASFGWMDCTCILRTDSVGEYIPINDFIDQAELWKTGGASSEGRMDIGYIDRGQFKTKSIKARKLMLPYVSNPAMVLAAAMMASISFNVSVVKSELAKIRIAVAGSLGFYIVWIYLHHLTGDTYNQMPGVTLAETPAQELIRVDDMLKACSEAGIYGLPADFEAFDSQPTILEQIVIGRCLLDTADRKAGFQIPLWLRRNAISGLRYSYLSTRDGGQWHNFRVEDYLPSGIAITSAIGNMFNCVSSESQIRLVEAWTRIPRSIWLRRIDLRGDDSSFMVTHTSYSYLLVLAAKLLSYRYARNKVAVIPGSTELLRVHYSARGARGYPARLIPAIIQRKPWSNEPWDPEGWVLAWWDTCCALKRRRQPGLELWAKLATIWGSIRGVDPAVLSAHRSDGGLGIGILSPDWRVLPGVGQIEKPLHGVRVSSTPWAGEVLQRRYQDWNIRLTATERAALVDEDQLATLTAGDLPIAAKIAQAQYKLLIPHWKITSRQAGRLGVAGELVLVEVAEYISRVGVTEVSGGPCAYVPILYGSYRRQLGQLAGVRRLLQYRTRAWMEAELGLGICRDAALLARRTGSSVASALDWLTGGFPIPIPFVHPQAAAFVSARVAYVVEVVSRGGVANSLGLGRLVMLVAQYLGTAFAEAPFHKRVFSW